MVHTGYHPLKHRLLRMGDQIGRIISQHGLGLIMRLRVYVCARARVCVLSRIFIYLSKKMYMKKVQMLSGANSIERRSL